MGDAATRENAVVRARVDPRLKAEASAVLDAMGLTLSDAFRMLLKRVVMEKALPFNPLIPNQETIAAMRAADVGDTVKAGRNAKAVMANLDAD